MFLTRPEAGSFWSSLLRQFSSWPVFVDCMNDLPGVHKVPVWVVLLKVVWVGGRWPVHEVKVDVVGSEGLEGGLDTLLDTLVPWVVELGGQPDLLTGDTRVLDSLSDLVLVAVSESGINVAVSGEERSLDGFADLVWLGLPGSETNGGHLCTLRTLSVCV